MEHHIRTQHGRLQATCRGVWRNTNNNKKKTAGKLPTGLWLWSKPCQYQKSMKAPPSPFPKPAEDDWDAFSQTLPHTQTQTLMQVSHLSQLSGPPEDSQRSPSQPTLNQVLREGYLLEQSPGLGIGRITQDKGSASEDELSEDEHTLIVPSGGGTAFR
jgi:hypothetical protein